MDKRQKDLKVMAEASGVTPLKFDRRKSRVYLMCEAENGATREFSVSTGGTSDVRGDQNEQSLMKRWARENAKPESTPQPKKAPATMQTPVAKLSPRQSASMGEQLATQMSGKTVTKEPAELGMKDMFRLCTWMKLGDLAKVPSMEALVLEASKHLGVAVQESTVREAMDATGVTEPVHWSEPSDPQAIIVREIGLLLKGLGQAPTDAFSKLAAAIVP